MKAYKILVPPILKTIEPGKDNPPTPPKTETRYDTIELSDADAIPLIESGVIAVTRESVESVMVQAVNNPESISQPTTVEDPLEDEQSDLEEEPKQSAPILNPVASSDLAININDLTVDEALPLIHQSSNRAYLETILQQESASKNRITIRNAITDRLEQLP